MKKTEFALFLLFILALLFINSLIIDAAYTTAFTLLGFTSPPSTFWKVPNFFSILLGLLAVFTAVIIILERRDPAKTLAWVLILIFLPVIGFVLYMTFGRQFRKRRMTAKKRVLNEYIYPLNETFAGHNDDIPGISLAKERLIHLILNNAEIPLTLYNDVNVLTNGQEIFPAFIAAISEAREHIHLETYILKNDIIGSKITDLLISKAQEGVKIRIIYDGLGSRHLGKEYLDKLRSAGIQIEPFFPVRLRFMHNRINYRNHRKILVVDGVTGFVGGVNIGDEYLGLDPQIGFWRDTHLQIRGNAVYFLQRIFLQDWYFITGESLEHTFTHLFPLRDKPGNTLVQITSSGPDTQWEAIMQVYYYSIATAQKSVHLTSPYFVPNESILTALKTAALSGVDVKLLLPAKSDHKIVYWAAMSYLEELMEAGVEIYLYHNGFLHAKVLSIDGLVTTIGTANMDQRSFSLNFEVNAFIYSEEIAARLECDFQKDLQSAEKLDLETYRERPLLNRTMESLSKLLSPLL